MSESTKCRLTITDKHTGEVTEEILDLTVEQLAELESLGARLCPEHAAAVVEHRSRS